MGDPNVRCEIVVGKLIAHKCGRGKAKRCDSCGRDACRRHRDSSHMCKVCAKQMTESKAILRLSDFGDPMDFAPEVYAAFERRAGAPEDELAGVDS
jgi:hypothetical protein